MTDSRAAGEWFDRHCYLKNRDRFFMTEPWEKIRQDILGTCGKRAAILARGESLYRAQDKTREGGTEPEALEPAEMRAPGSGEARPARFNPSGVSFLYLSMRPETAIAEVRPQNGAVTVARFEIVKGQKLVDARSGGAQQSAWFYDQPREMLVWECLHDYLSTAVPSEQEDGAYDVSRRLAAAFLLAGYDGIIYPSAYHPPGSNVVLFDPEGAVPVVTEVCRVYSSPGPAAGRAA